MLNVKRNEILLIILISIAIVIPFANQAFSIDDDIYLNAAIKYNESGFDSLRGKSEQEGFMYPNYYITHPLVWPWFLSIYMEVFNASSEFSLHLISIISLIIIGISSISISRRFSDKPLFAGIFFLFMPAIVLLSHLMMTDIPTLAFFLLALSFHIEGIEKKSVLFLILSGLSSVIACGISYQALYILFLIPFYNFLKKEKNFTSLISIIIPALAFIIWCVYTWKEFGIAHPFIAFEWANMAERDLLDNFLPKLIANINTLGAVTVFPLFLLLVYFFKRRFRNFILLSFLVSIISALIFVSNYSFIQKSLFVIYFTAGFFILLRFVILFFDSLKAYKEKKILSSKKDIFLSVWFITFCSLIIITMPLGVARYLLPGFLPLVIVFINDLRDFIDSKKFKLITFAGISLTLCWSILCSIADYQFAESYRNVSQKINDKYKNQNVWFCSDGLKWYMEKKGFKPLLYGDTRTEKGDIIVLSSESWSYKVPEIMEKTILIDKISYNSNYPVRTFNLASHAGFHDHNDALLPFSITRSGYEKFSVYRIIK